MKILQILPELTSGGVERGTLELGRAALAAGHQSLVVSHGGPLVTQLESEGSRHFTQPVHRKALSSLRQVAPLRQLLEREAPDILHLRSRLPAWLAYLAWRGLDPLTRPRLVTTVHGFYSINFYSSIMTRGERVIAVSHAVQEYIQKNYSKSPPAHQRVIPRGVDPTDYHPAFTPPATWVKQWESDHPELQGKFLLLLPGRLTRWKGQLDFLEMLAHLRRNHPRAHGLLVGSAHPKKKAFETELRTRAAQLGLTEHLTFLGRRSDLREIMTRCDLCCSLSTDPEAFGRVSLEALSLGLPTLGYHHGGVAEQLDALFPEGAIPPGDWQSAARLAHHWASQPADQRPRPRPNTLFTLERMTGQTLQLYDELLASPRTARKTSSAVPKASE